jgi:hypothetical protein
VVSLATMVRYLPHPGATLESVPSGKGFRQASCTWSGTSDGQDRTMESTVVIYTAVHPTMSRAQKLSAAIAMARDVLAGLPR